MTGFFSVSASISKTSAIGFICLGRLVWSGLILVGISFIFGGGGSEDKAKLNTTVVSKIFLIPYYVLTKFKDWVYFCQAV